MNLMGSDVINWEMEKENAIKSDCEARRGGEDLQRKKCIFAFCHALLTSKTIRSASFIDESKFLNVATLVGTFDWE